jgi:hypothetical protein
MAFYVPMHTIVEAMQYDGTFRSAGEIEDWAKLKILKPGINFAHVVGGFCFVVGDLIIPGFTHFIKKGDYVVIENGEPKVVPGKEFDLNYVQIPS